MSQVRKVAFWLNELCERGTAIAVFDYAYYNQKMFGNISYILYEKNSVHNMQEVIEKFSKEFCVHGCNDFSEADPFLQKHNIDLLYIIKAGGNDGKISKVAKNFIHCVFVADDPHGDVYACISDSVVGHQQHMPILPHMINLPQHHEDMREHLGIPKDATVYGRYGGKQQFSVIGIHHLVEKVAKENPQMYFIFVNTDVFCPPLPTIIHLNAIIDLHEKRKFINTCDAMIWARADGETFGLSIGEFSTCNRPVIAFLHENISADYHIKTLKKNAYWFRTAEEFVNILTGFNRETAKLSDWNMYKEFTPEKVMQKFQELVLKN